MPGGTHEYIQDPRNDNVLIYINGEMLPRPEAKVSVFDSGFLLGDGVWEGIRLHNGQLVFCEEHIDRLYIGAAAIGMDIGMSKNDLVAKIHDTLAANEMYSDIHLRLIISRGLKTTPYQHPRVNIGGPTVVIIPEYKVVTENSKSNGLKLVSVTTSRASESTQDPKINSLSKFNCIQACIEADRLGGDEGLMLDMHGYVSTCNSTNFFIVRGSEVLTSTGEYCLNGVTRGAIIDLCRANNIDVLEKNFLTDNVYTADEAFVTGTFAGVLPVTAVNEHVLSNGLRGPLTKKLQDLYRSEIDKRYPGK
ncbi:MAG TPA: aminotransferase class IV [Candidatus Marinimicrobia bacterium]|jgi:branched-chain amino acid aminotransferase|nr:aminotransferase class IV [Candidatus Neomarinimicrobiota bacterium]